MTIGGCHVLMIPYAGPLLHLVRMMRLSKLLLERGCRITLLIAEDEMRVVDRKLFRGWKDGIDIIEVTSPSEVEGSSPEGYMDNAAANLELSCLPYLRKQVEEKASGKVGGISVMIADAFLAWTQGWADRLQIPRYVMMPAACDTLFFVDFPRLMSEGLLESGKDELISVEGMPLMHLSETFPSLRAALTGGKNYPEFVLEIGTTMVQAKGVLINTCYELEKAALDAYHKNFVPHTFAIMPSTYLIDEGLVSGNSGSSHPCLRWLDSQSPSSVLFVAFGSWGAISDEQITELALGLESSGVPFLLCLPASSTHPSILIDGFEKRVQERALVVTDWVPQRLILSHPATTGFLTHSGWNSTVESICRGIPFVALPEKANQGMICR